MPVEAILKDPTTGDKATVTNRRLDVNANLLGNFGIDTDYDYIALTYVAAGNGAGEIETVTYKTGGSGGTTIATLTLAYNASDEISSITKS